MKQLHYLVTGHTGFKGAWFTVLLRQLGHKVSGISLDPIEGALFSYPGFSELMEHDLRLDIRESEALRNAFHAVSPDVVVHMAAQPLVLTSWEIPHETYEINVMGTLNVLEAVQHTPSVKAVLVVTTDKVYSQVPNTSSPFVESDPLGAADPYSTSKAMADLLTQAWAKANEHIPTGIARAGNVIGGGDVSENRLIPDLIRAHTYGGIVEIRNPSSVRPWQHVLDCLYGYFRLSQALITGNAEGQWNFAPPVEQLATVKQVVEIVESRWPLSVEYSTGMNQRVPESSYLSLDANKAINFLGWNPKLDLFHSVSWTIDWHNGVHVDYDALSQTTQQVADYLEIVANSEG